jgi:predicted Zn-dependent protease
VNYALVAILAGEPAVAERELAEYARGRPPGDVGALPKLIQAYAAVGERRRIRSLMEEAIRARPGDAALRAQYAAVLAALGEEAPGR